MRDLFFLDRARLAAAVIAAVSADLVRHLGLVALRALAEAHRLQRIVRAALGRPRLGVSSFWIWHLLVFRRSSQLSAFLFSFFRAASLGSSQSRLQPQVSTFRFVPQTTHSPLQSSRQSGFIGSDR